MILVDGYQGHAALKYLSQDAGLVRVVDEPEFRLTTRQRCSLHIAVFASSTLPLEPLVVLDYEIDQRLVEQLIGDFAKRHRA